MMRKEVKEQHFFSKNLEHRITDLDSRIDKLINTYLEGVIGKETFLRKKNELLERKVELQEQLNDFWDKGLVWVEPLLAGQGGSLGGAHAIQNGL